MFAPLIYAANDKQPVLTDAVARAILQAQRDLQPLQFQQQQIIQAYNDNNAKLGPANAKLNDLLNSALKDSGIDADKCKCVVDPATLAVIPKPPDPPKPATPADTAPIPAAK